MKARARQRPNNPEPELKEVCKILRVNNKNLKVTKREDYPHKNGFPVTLKELLLSQIQLSKIDRRILTLKNLQVLNLSQNALTFTAIQRVSYIYNINT